MAKEDILEILASMTEDEVIDELRSLDRKMLLYLRSKCGTLDDCKCKIVFLPCAKHTQWRTWRKQGYSPRAIAHLWQERAREFTFPEDVEDFFKRKSQYCDCPNLCQPCPSTCVAKNQWLTTRAQIELKRLLDPFEFEDPPEPLEPCKALTTASKAVTMAHRVRAGFGAFHPHDLLNRKYAVDYVEREVHRGKNGTPIPGSIEPAKEIKAPVGEPKL